MSDLYSNIDDLINDVNEDNIIKEILSEHPELFDQLNYNEFTIKDRLEKNPWMQEMWRLLYIKEKHKLHRIEILKDEYLGKLYEKLKYNDSRKLTKKEIEHYFIPKDEKSIKFAKLMMKQEIRVEVFESIYESFKAQGWLMKQYLKNMIDG